MHLGRKARDDFAKTSLSVGKEKNKGKVTSVIIYQHESSSRSLLFRTQQEFSNWGGEIEMFTKRQIANIKLSVLQLIFYTETIQKIYTYG